MDTPVAATPRIGEGKGASVIAAVLKKVARFLYNPPLIGPRIWVIDSNSFAAIHFFLQPVVRAGILHPDRWVRYCYVGRASAWGLAQLTSVIVAALQDADHAVRELALETAAEWHLDEVDEAVVSTLSRGTWLEKITALYVVADRGGREALPHVIPLLQDADDWVRSAAKMVYEGICEDGTCVCTAAGPSTRQIRELDRRGWTVVNMGPSRGRLYRYLDPLRGDYRFLDCPLPPEVLARRRRVEDLVAGCWVVTGSTIWRLERDPELPRLVLAKCRLPVAFRRRPWLARRLTRDGQIRIGHIRYVLQRNGLGSWSVCQCVED